MKPTGIIDAIADLGLQSGTDIYFSLQQAINANPGVGLVRFPQAATYYFSQPLIVDRRIYFESPALGLVTLSPFPGKCNPIFCFGLRQNENGNVVTDANRPDCLGSGLDRSFVSAPNLLRGYRTLGTSFLVANAHPIQIGQRSATSGDHSWDYWSECQGITLECALLANQPFQPGDCLYCWGSSQFQPAPICLTVAPDGSGRFCLAFKTADMSPLWDTPFASCTFGNANANGLIRLQAYIDFNAGVAGALQGGIAQQITWISPVPRLKGNRLQRNRAAFSFFAGADQGVYSAGGFRIPDFTTFGLRVSRIARTTDPGSDGKRLLNDPDTIALLPGSGPSLRSLDLTSGMAADSLVGTAWIVPNRISGGGIASGGLRNLVLTGGSPAVVNVATLGLTIESCEIHGYYVGLGNLPLIASYPVNIRTSVLSGGDAAISLWRSSVSLRDNVIERGGITSMRFIGCNVHSENDRIAFTSGGAETGIEILQEQYGGAYDFTNIDIDSESATPFSDAVFRIETHPYTTTILTLTRPIVSGIGANASYVSLVGHPVVPGVYNPAKLVLESPSVYTTDYKAAISAGVGWYGSADLRSLPNAKITGAAAANIVTPSAVTPQNPTARSPSGEN